jgi:hypothetical protein
MRVAIHQPHYLPWLRYVEKIASSDLFILLDDVAFTTRGWQNRNKIKGPNGWMYLTVPVTAKWNEPINEVGIAHEDWGNWGEKHLRALEANYSRAPYFKAHMPWLQEIYCRKWTRLGELDDAYLRCLLDQMGVHTPVVNSSDLNVGGVGTTRLLNLCKAVGAASYYSGAYAANAYMDTAMFEEAGIGLELQHWRCPEYRQQFPKAGFVPDMAIVDLLFNEGPDALDILRSGIVPA